MINMSSIANRRVRRGHQKGVVLAMALILLVIISIVAVVAARSSISGEQVSKSLRTNAVAMEAAETAMRYCESEVLANRTTVKVAELPLTGDPVLWQTRSNWADSTIATVVPDAVANSANPNARKLPVAALPRCVVERYPLRALPGATPRESYLVTAIGYSPDYTANAAGRLQSGSEVWLQSIVRK
ncbi:MAG: hypothetical protein EOO27_21170 [Comamonadaceae bacterium]|nr:MAG: hypothetical protein EOO27_21170 [Comamonadaceae bacterium]